MRIRKKHLTVLIPAVLIWLTALVIATLYDLEISLAVADARSLYGRFFEIAGEPPAILFASFNFFLLMAYSVRCLSGSVKGKIPALLFAILGAGTAVYASINTFDYLKDYLGSGSNYILLALLCAAVICILFVAAALKISGESLKKIYPIAMSCVLAAVFTFVIIWALKLVWGRVRFRSMDGDISLFTPWYVINGFTGGFSFPSGHTANATVVFTVSHYLRFVAPEFKWAKPLVYAALCVWIPVVAFSRVCIGAHFLSDVLFGAAVTLLIVYFTRPKEEL